MHKISSVLLTVLAALAAPALTLAAAPAAHAADTGLPVLVTPADTATVPDGFEYPVTLDLTHVAPGVTLTVDLDCTGQGPGVMVRYVTYSPDPDTFGVVPLRGPQSCTFTARDASTGDPATPFGSITVAAPAPAPAPDPEPAPEPAPAPPALVLSSATISATSFYPRVVDGYRDTVVTRWTANRAANTTVSILNSRGTTVRRASYTALAKGAHMWTWNGRGSDGRVVAVGAYRVRVSSAVAGVTRTFTKSVTVASTLINRTGSAAREGYNSSPAATSSCYVTQDDYYDYVTSLDCWGGRYARANYNFRVPATAFNVHWSASGRRNGGDICCDGRITKTGTRVNSTLFQVRVQVTGWRAYDVSRAAISYTYKVRR